MVLEGVEVFEDYGKNLLVLQRFIHDLMREIWKLSFKMITLVHLLINQILFNQLETKKKLLSKKPFDRSK